jgi:hypothetical protein
MIDGKICHRAIFLDFPKIKRSVVMKRCFSLPVYVFTFVFISVLLISACSPDWPQAHISNDSSYQVTFKFAHYDQEHTLSAGQAINFNGDEWSRALDSYTPDKRVLYSSTSNHDGLRGTFKNRPSWELRVNNLCSGSVTLTADGWMDPMANITLGYVDNNNHNGVIFTQEPSFAVITDNFPAVAKYQIVNDILYVTISY